MQTYTFDERRKIVIPGSYEATIAYCAEQIISSAKAAIADHHHFYWALSGGHTPKTIFERLCGPDKEKLDWSAVKIFWSDERSVPPENPESNYAMAMFAGLSRMPIPPNNLFRMYAEAHIVENAKIYEKLIKKNVPHCVFDLIMLGMGEDGHTASLFPHTKALDNASDLVVANEIPQKKTWRMTFTYPLLQCAQQTCIYALGAAKAAMIQTIFSAPYDYHTYPIQKVGTAEHPALWILDNDAAALILPHLKKG